MMKWPSAPWFRIRLRYTAARLRTETGTYDRAGHKAFLCIAPTTVTTLRTEVSGLCCERVKPLRGLGAWLGLERGP
jgi:hypothetical protein